MNAYSQKNAYRITRQDGSDCFVEVKSDFMHHGKLHLQFVTYDTSKPEGQRYTQNINYYLDFDEFLMFAHHATNGDFEEVMKQSTTGGKFRTLYRNFAGTPAAKLKTPRKDGKDLSRTIELVVGGKIDYMLIAKTGPGKTVDKGAIKPDYKKPEQSITIAMTQAALTRLALISAMHIGAWVASQYAKWEVPSNLQNNNGVGE